MNINELVPMKDIVRSIQPGIEIYLGKELGGKNLEEPSHFRSSQISTLAFHDLATIFWNVGLTTST